MTLRQKLQNPFALVAQGFALGGLIFFAVHSEALEARAASAPAQAPISGR